MSSQRSVPDGHPEGVDAEHGSSVRCLFRLLYVSIDCRIREGGTDNAC